MIKKLVESSTVMYKKHSEGGQIINDDGDLTTFYSIAFGVVIIALVLLVSSLEFVDL